MAQAQPRREDDPLLQAQGNKAQQQDQDHQGLQSSEQAAIRYGHVFAVTGDLAGQPIAPRDAAAMRSAEDSVPGVQVPQGAGGGFSAATAMETAAAYNQAVGAVSPGQASDAATAQGITVTQTAVPGGRIVTEFVAGQVVGQYSVADPPPPVEEDATKITIGEALEATARAGGGRLIDRADAEAIAAEMSAHGADVAMPGGLGDQARAAARANAQATRDGDKVKIGDVLSDATAKLAGDKAARTEDATRVLKAERFNDAEARARAGGVGAAVTTAARLNEDIDLGDAWEFRSTPRHPTSLYVAVVSCRLRAREREQAP